MQHSEPTPGPAADTEQRAAAAHSRPTPQPIAEVNEGRAFAQQLLEATHPVVLRGGLRHWALCETARQGPAATLDYLQARDTGHPVYTIVGQPHIAGRFGYAEGFRSLNHEARQAPLAAVLPHLRHSAAEHAAHAIAVQAAPVRQLIRNWDKENPMPILPPEVAPTLWISNRAQVAPHSDIHDNIACVAAGSREFVLFPPEQIRNLYLGPLLNAPGGVPTSTVDPWQPELERHPRFAEALAAASSATLYPGDALFIPALWWHAVRARDAINVLVNFWWGGGAGPSALSPYEAMSHAILAISALPAAKRRRWQQYFDYLVFRSDEDPAAHLPAETADLLSTVNDAQSRALLLQLAQSLSQHRR